MAVGNEDNHGEEVCRLAVDYGETFFLLYIYNKKKVLRREEEDEEGSKPLFLQATVCRREVISTLAPST